MSQVTSEVFAPGDKVIFHKSAENVSYTRKDGSVKVRRTGEQYPGVFVDYLGEKSAKVRLELRGRPHIKTVLLKSLTKECVK